MSINFDEFVAWQKEKPESRSISFKKGWDRDGNTVWVYDYNLMAGQHVKSVEEIDLIAERRKDLERQIKKFEALKLGREAHESVSDDGTV